MCESILSTAPSTVSTGRRNCRREQFCHPDLVRRGDRRGSSNWMSPLVSLIGQALSVRGATSTGSGVRRARRTLHSGGIQNRTSSRKGERMWARPQLRGGRKVGLRPEFCGPHDQGAQGSASPEGVERAAPDQGQGRQAASPKDESGGLPWCRAGAARAEPASSCLAPRYPSTRTTFRRLGIRTSTSHTSIAPSGASAAT